MAPDLEVRALTPEDRPWLEPLLTSSWGSTRVVSRGRLHDVLALPGFAAMLGGEPVGAATYEVVGDECELVTIDSVVDGSGVGSALLDAVTRVASDAGCRRLWLITTNDNTSALRFYQRRGLTLVALYPRAVEESRRLKPELPELGADGIPIRDELELELLL